MGIISTSYTSSLIGSHTKILCHVTWVGHSSPLLKSKFSYATGFRMVIKEVSLVEAKCLRLYYSLCLPACLMCFINHVNGLHSVR